MTATIESDDRKNTRPKGRNRAKNHHILRIVSKEPNYKRHKNSNSIETGAFSCKTKSHNNALLFAEVR